MAISIRVVNVRGLRTPEQRAAVCYVGRAFAGWPATPWENPFRIGETSPGNYKIKMDREHVLEVYRTTIEAREEGGTLDRWLAGLWEACDHGAKPLGCWCINATHGDGQPIVCHAQILAEMLHKRFIEENGK